MFRRYACLSTISHRSHLFLPRTLQSSARLYSNTATDPLKDTLKTQLKTSMKAGDKMTTTVIKSILSEVSYAEKAALTSSTPKPVSVAQIIQKLMKKRSESANAYRSGGREDLAVTEEKEISIMQGFLPKQMTEDDLVAVVKGCIERVGASSPKDVGKVMALLSQELDVAIAPRKLVSDIAKRLLSV